MINQAWSKLNNLMKRYTDTSCGGCHLYRIAKSHHSFGLYYTLRGYRNIKTDVVNIEIVSRNCTPIVSKVAVVDLTFCLPYKN